MMDKSLPRDYVIMGHITNLTEQVRRLSEILRAAGIAVPPDVGTFGMAPPEVSERLMRESLERRYPGMPLLAFGEDGGGPEAEGQD